MSYYVELRVSTGLLPHAGLALKVDNDPESVFGYGPIVDEDGYPIGPNGEIQKLPNTWGQVSINEGYKWDDYSGWIEISEDQFNNLLDYIENSSKNPPAYAFWFGAECANWAVDALNNAGIISDWMNTGVDPSELPIYLGIFEDFFQTLLVNPYTLPLLLEVNNLYIAALNFIIRVSDPLVLDLDGDGIETTGVNPNLLFDHNADGVKTGTGWVKSDDGMLVLDRNGNGSIDSGRELFGDQTLKANGQLATDGFDALRDMDSNGDNVFDAADATFAQMRVWRDLNHDGVSQTAELFTLQEAGVASISLKAVDNPDSALAGGTLTHTSSYTTTDGVSSSIGNVNFTPNDFYREFTDKIEIPEALKDLPDMQGSGMARDLREAAALSPKLATLLEEYAAATSREQQLGMLDQLLDAWADSADFKDWIERINETRLGSSELARGLVFKIAPPDTAASGAIDAFMSIADTSSDTGGASMEGIHNMLIDGRDLFVGQYDDELLQTLARIRVLEVFNASEFMDFSVEPVTEDQPVPIINSRIGSNFGSSGRMMAATDITITQRAFPLVPAQRQWIENAYEKLKDSVYDALVGQTRLKPYLDEITLTIDADGKLALDFSSLESLIQARTDADPVSGLADFIELFLFQGNSLANAGWQPDKSFIPTVFNALSPEELAAFESFAGSMDVDDFSYGGSETDRLGRSGGDSLRFGNAGDDYLNGYGGNDVLLGGDGFDKIAGGEGDDHLEGDAGNDHLSGDNGNDELVGGDGDDSLMGGHGNDELWGGLGNDTLMGGTGNDIYYFNRGDGLDVINDLATNAATANRLVLGDGIHREDLSFARHGNDLIISIAGALKEDSIRLQHCFLGGSDSSSYHLWVEIAGETLSVSSLLANADVSILGVTQNDDRLMGTDQVNVIDGLEGNDSLYGFGGDDDLMGDSGNDTLDGGDGNDKLWGGLGDDTLNGGTGNDLLLGGDGIDRLTGGEGYDYLEGGAGNDYLNGENGNDELLGGDGYDTLIGGKGNDSLRGGRGNDSLDGSSGADNYYFNRGDGQDTISDYDTDAVTVNRLILGEGIGREDLGFAREGSDLIISINGTNDSIRLQQYYTLIFSQIEQVEIAGETVSLESLLAGKDTYLFGLGDGNITISYSDSGVGQNDVLRFMEGIDPRDVRSVRSSTSLVLTVQSTGEVITVAGFFSGSKYEFSAVEFADGTVWDTEAIKTLVLGATDGNDIITGYDSNDTIDAAGGNDFLYGADGNDSLSGGGGDDGVFGQNGNDTLNGGGGVDRLYGENGNDLLDGGDGTDYLYGGSGDDTLRGGLGLNDFLSGDAGNDTYRWGIGEGHTTISNNDAAAGRRDVLRFDAGITPDDVWVKRSGSSLQLPVQSSGEVITVANYFSGSSFSLNAIEFEDGTSWDVAIVEALSIQGTAGNDNLQGFARNDVLSGGDGNDTLNGKDGNDTLNGDAGTDRLYGENGNDFLDGGNGTDYLYGGSGDDTLQGGSGPNDFLSGDAGNDIYRWGIGEGHTTISNYDAAAGRRDVLRFDARIAPGDVLVKRNGDSLLLAVQGSGEVITVANYFTGSSYSLNAIEFDDGTSWDVPTVEALSIQGTAGSDNLQGFAWNDVLSGGDGNDTLFGKDGNDTLNGDAGADRLYGENGNDLLDGGDGTDYLYGGSGDDTLRGGSGVNDVLSGDAGNDRYIIAAGSQSNVINNYDTSNLYTDVAEFRDAAVEDIWFSRSGNNLLISIAGTSDQATISNWYASDAYKLDQFEAGSSVLLSSQVEQLVSAMASFSVPSGEGNIIPQDVKDALQVTLTAAWQ